MDQEAGVGNLCTEDVADSLVAQADSQSRSFLAYAPQNVRAYSEILPPGWGSGTRRDYHAVRFYFCFYFVQRYLVVSVDLRVSALHPNVLYNVVHEGVIVIEHEYGLLLLGLAAGCQSSLFSPVVVLSSARINASDFRSVSYHSVSGIESATIPAPDWTEASPSLETSVLIVIAKSMFPLNVKYPSAPAYGPRGSRSSSSIICIALIFGAPETVPAGKRDRMASKLDRFCFNLPVTCETMCCTCEYLCTCMNSPNLTEPNCAILPMSLRARSTSITCSALSLGSARSCSPSL